MGKRFKVGINLGVSLAALLAATGAHAQQSAAPSAADDSQESAEIVVTGIRSSIQNALNLKRQSENIVDSISAQDIGKLPDQNVVDTLSRIPGVQITRSNGEGANFTIRGINLNTIFINDRPYVGAAFDSVPRLDVIGSDIIGAIDVIKSPSADLVEGALGGTVNLRTKRPLELPDMTIGLRAQGQYGDNVGKYGFRGSALISKRFADDRAGVLLNVAYQNLWGQTELFDASNFTRVNNIDGNGDGVADPGLWRPTRLQYMRLPRRVERTTINGALQFKPTETTQILLEGTYARQNASAQSNRFQLLLTDAVTNATADATGTVRSATVSGVTVRPLQYLETDRADTLVLGANAKWENNGLSVVLDGSYSKGKSPITGTSAVPVVVPRNGNTANVVYNFGSTDIPSAAINANFDINNPSAYRLNAIVDGYSKADNDSKAARVDLGYDTGWNFLSKLSAGYRYEDRTFFVQRFDQPGTLTLASVLTTNDRNADGVITPDEIPGLVYTGLAKSNVLEGLSGAFPANFIGGTLDRNAMRAGFNYQPVLNPTATSDVELRTHALYVKANLDGDLGGLSFRGHVGSRFVWSKRMANGFINVPGTGVQPVSFEKSYNEVLPSASLIFDLKKNLLLRFAAARVLAAPPLTDVAPGFTFSIVNNQGSGGNPLLNPYKADQFDAALEWYFAPSSLLSVGFFTKNVKSFTVNAFETVTIPGFVNPNNPGPGGNVFQILRPQNGENGKISGFEVNYQHALTFLPAPFDGLGLQANYTYADSSTPNLDPLTGKKLPFTSLSKNSYSLIGYYEKGPITARLAYTHRDKYVLALQGIAAGGVRYVDDQSQMDGSVAIALTKQVKLTFDAQNILKKPERRYDGVESRLVSVISDDRRFFLGFSAAF